MNKRKSSGKVQVINPADPYSLGVPKKNASPKFKINSQQSHDSNAQKNSSIDKVNSSGNRENPSIIAKTLYNSKSISNNGALKKFNIKNTIDDIHYKTNGNITSSRYNYAIKSGKKKANDFSSRGASQDVLKKNKSEEFNIKTLDNTNVKNEYLNFQSNLNYDNSPDPTRSKNKGIVNKYSIRNHFIPENLKQHQSKREPQESISRSITLNKQKILSYNHADKVKKDLQFSISKINENTKRNFNSTDTNNEAQNIYNKDMSNRSSQKTNQNTTNNYKIKQYMTLDFRNTSDLYQTAKSPTIKSKDKTDADERLSNRNQNMPLGNRQTSFQYLSKKSGIKKATLASSGNINERGGPKNQDNNNSVLKNLQEKNLIPGMAHIDSNLQNSQTTKRPHFISPKNFYATSNALSKRDGSKLDSSMKYNRNESGKSYSRDQSNSRGQSPKENNPAVEKYNKNRIVVNDNFVSTIAKNQRKNTDMTYNKNANNNQRKNTDISNSNRIRNQDLSNDTEINLYEQKMSENVSKNTHHKLSDSNHNGEHNRDKSNSRNNQNDYYTKPQYNNMAAHFPKEKSNEQLKIIKVNKNIKNNFYVKNILSKWKKVKIMWNGKPSDFPNVNNEQKAISQLGKGSFATVYEAYDRRLKINVAVKVYEKKDLEQPERRVFVQNEVDIISNIDHKHIANYYRLLEDAKAIYIAQEIGGAISLSEFVRRCEDKKLKENDARIQFKQLISAVSYCHDLRICHRDLKLTNILINEEGELKQIDFGFSTIANRMFKTYCGTPSYMSPELVKKHEYEGIAVDLWAMGVILYKMVTGDYPFGSEKDKFLNQRILACDLKMPSYVSIHCRNLIIACLQQNPEHRISGKEMERHPFIKGGLGLKNAIDTSNSELDVF